jgi:RNA polymerase sigma-70 factor (ECF subfamily)
MGSMCEEELTAALARDLDGHFEQLVLTYQRRIFGFALRLVGEPRDAEEIAQDTFVRAYRALVGYPAERIRALRAQAWLYQIALNIVRNQARKRVVPTQPSLDFEDGAPALEIADDARGEPAARAEAAEERRELERVLTALPVHFRAAVILRHVEGRTYREIAEILGEPAGTVKSHTHRGTLLLRRMLAGEKSEVKAWA